MLNSKIVEKISQQFCNTNVTLNKQFKKNIFKCLLKQKMSKIVDNWMFLRAITTLFPSTINA